jgi:hypothetical protein
MLTVSLPRSARALVPAASKDGRAEVLAPAESDRVAESVWFMVLSLLCCRSRRTPRLKHNAAGMTSGIDRDKSLHSRVILYHV